MLQLTHLDLLQQMLIKSWRVHQDIAALSDNEIGSGPKRILARKATMVDIGTTLNRDRHAVNHCPDFIRLLSCMNGESVQR